MTSTKIEHLPPSAKLVFKVLESGSLLTQKDIIEKTYLPARTVRYALSRLKEKKVLQERFYFQDARQSLYGLNPETLEVMAE
ncbi:MAG: MarR family transcriptional regulator [Methanotrichaceae archaeon]